jgi:hypothetical protein
MKRIFIALILVLSVVGGTLTASQANEFFLTGIDDLPLMPGLSEDVDSTLVFDSPGGRYVEAIAAGSMKVVDVTAFYQSTLPQLGWVKTGGKIGGMPYITFEREEETLLLEISNNANGVNNLRVRFVVSPKK